LPGILLGLGAAPEEDAVISSAELVLDVPQHLPGQLAAASEVLPYKMELTLKTPQPPPMGMLLRPGGHFSPFHTVPG
jgi:hypothetical protein